MSKHIDNPCSRSTQLVSVDEVTANEQLSSARLSRAGVLLRDSRSTVTPPSARIVAAFDAIYLCCLRFKDLSSQGENDVKNANSDVVLAVADLIAATTEKLGIPPDGVDLALRLMKWSFFGLEKDMPCTPARASDLAEAVLRETKRLHLNSGDSRF